MRLLHSWEDLRSRWSSKDASGIGLEEVDGIISPVIVVGGDQSDDAGVNLYGARIPVPGGNFGAFRIDPSAATWIHALRVSNFAAGANVYAYVERDSTIAPVAPVNQLYAGPQFPTLGVEQILVGALPPVTRMALLPPAEWVTFPSPGLLLGLPGFSRAWDTFGARLRVECDTLGEDFTLNILFRSA